MDPTRQLAQKIISRGKWGEMLSRFKDVLRINLFIVDSQGMILLSPDELKYGGRLLFDNLFGFPFLQKPGEFLNNFERQGLFFESINKFNLHCFAIAINLNNHQNIAYLVVGPVILNKRLEISQYRELAKKYGADEHVLLGEINGVRAVSNVMMNSILDLLLEIVRDTVELSLKVKESEDLLSPDTPTLSREVKDVAREIYSAVRLDELLVALLDIALKMTDAECGSIMVIDEIEGTLSIKVARGLENSRVEETRLRLGEGISGLVAIQNVPIIINGQDVRSNIMPPNRIKDLLNRPEIKHSLIMPLMAKERVFGILNLHTKKNENKIEDNIDNLQYLARLLSAAF